MGLAVDQVEASLGDPTPPDAYTLPLQALWWLKKGGLVPGPAMERAHAICQSAEGTPVFDRVHALVHWIEGDSANADYWYRRAGVAREGADVAADWAWQVVQFGG